MRGSGLGDGVDGGTEEGRAWSFDLGFGCWVLRGRREGGGDRMIDVSRTRKKNVIR